MQEGPSRTGGFDAHAQNRMDLPRIASEVSLGVTSPAKSASGIPLGVAAGADWSSRQPPIAML